MEDFDIPGAASLGSGSHLGSVKSSTVLSLVEGKGAAEAGSFSSCSSSPSTSEATMQRIVSVRSRRWRRMGSATLCKRTPTGSMIRKHRMVLMYCEMTSLVSAPG